MTLSTDPTMARILASLQHDTVPAYMRWQEAPDPLVSAHPGSTGAGESYRWNALIGAHSTPSWDAAKDWVYLATAERAEQARKRRSELCV